MKAGIVSDTHGYVPGALWELLDGVDIIFHAGDVGDEAVLRELEAIAPVRAVLGNTDRWITSLPDWLRTDFCGMRLIIDHIQRTDARSLRARALSVGAAVFLFGHTHRPFLRLVGETLFVNPGSCSRSRSGTNTAGFMQIVGGIPHISIHSLDDGGFPEILRYPSNS